MWVVHFEREKRKFVKKLLHALLEILQSLGLMNSKKKTQKNQSWKLIGFTKINGLQNWFGLYLFMGVGKIKMVRCKIWFKIEGKDKLLVQKLDFLNMHSSWKKCNVAKLGMTMVHIMWTLTMHTCENWKIVCFHRVWYDWWLSWMSREGREEEKICAICCRMALVEIRTSND